MIGQYRIITLCGSTRFKDAFMEAQKRLTLEGNIVISVGLFGHSGDDEVWTEGTKAMLDDMHKRKIDLADEIYVINVDGYIGESTRSEIAYAEETGKKVRYLEEPETVEKEPEETEPQAEAQVSVANTVTQVEAETSKEDAEVQDEMPASAEDAETQNEEQPVKDTKSVPDNLSEVDVNTIKIKLGKSHRKESDWDTIKTILSSHSVMTIAPANEDPEVPTVEGILYEDGAFVVFTNRDDCDRHIRHINRVDGKPDREFEVRSVAFDEAVAIADQYGKDLYVDFQPEENCICLVYQAESHTLQAVLLQNVEEI